MSLFISLNSLAQDSTMIDMPDTAVAVRQGVEIFSSEKAINANTTEMVGKGKMDFKVSHSFDDLAGSKGGIKDFFGLDNSTDVRIGFHLGITDRFNINVARAKGNGAIGRWRGPELYEIALKFLLAQQFENDPRHPLAIALFASNVISSANIKYNPPRDPVTQASLDTSLNQLYTYEDFGDRMSQVLQLIFARKMGKVSLLLSPTLVHTGHVALHDQNTIFALGSAIRVPIGRSVNLLVDHFFTFRSKESKDYFNSVDNTFNPPSDIDKNSSAFKFYNPLGVGIEILTAGHVFRLNFTNATETMENRFIPYTLSTWGKGEFRWAFTISRKFVVWRTE